MYIPKHFQMTEEDMYAVIEEFSFAALCSVHEGKPYATHMPLMLDRGSRCLRGHFARANPQWQDIAGQEVLVMFQGPHCYISPSWYESKQAVPTWNYAAVHVYGTVELLDDEAQIQRDLQQLIHKYEAADSAYVMAEAGEAFLGGLLKGIVPFAVSISRLEGKAKLSQNHPAARRERISAHLAQSAGENERRIASLMKQKS